MRESPLFAYLRIAAAFVVALTLALAFVWRNEDRGVVAYVIMEVVCWVGLESVAYVRRPGAHPDSARRDTHFDA